MEQIIHATHFAPRQQLSLLRLISPGTGNLVAERDAYRQAKEHLAFLYGLHRELADKLTLSSLLETLSQWLTTHVTHELLAFQSADRRHQHLVCSCHGPQRHDLEETAREWLERPEWTEYGVFRHEHTLFVVPWSVTMEGGEQARMLILCRDLPEDVVALRRFVGSLREELGGALGRTLTFETIYAQARRDTLTGLYNRHVFLERAAQERVAAQRYGHPPTLLYMDLDHFKAVNDCLGHAAGDDALRQVAMVLDEMVRDADLLARLGGDEFVLLLPSTDLAQAQNLAERICQAVAQLGIQAPGRPPLGVSIGIAEFHNGETLEQWLERADAALYRAKEGGRSRAVA